MLLTPHIVNLALVANTENHLVIPAGVREFSMQPRGSNNVQFAFAAGVLAGAYMTLKGVGGSYELDLSDAKANNAITIYFICSATEAIELCYAS